jgi:hypothetical protein
MVQGRINKLKKSLWQELRLDIVAPDAPHLHSDNDGIDFVDEDSSAADNNNSDQWKRTWWHRSGNTYRGLEESLTMLDRLWNKNGNNNEYVAIFGFSQGSRLAHIISIIHKITNGRSFPGLDCVIHFSGYGDCALPENLTPFLKDYWSDSILASSIKISSPSFLDDVRIDVPSLHVMGESDALIPLKSSEAMLTSYIDPSVYIHPGSHFVPVKRLEIERYITFLSKAIGETSTTNQQLTDHAFPPSKADDFTFTATPDKEHAETQIDEVAALAQIFPSEFRLLSKSFPKNPDNYDPDDYFGENRSYEHPIRYSIFLQPQDDCLLRHAESLWPPRNLSLCIEYPADYPDLEPQISLIHDMNYFEFSMESSNAVMAAVRNAMLQEAGMPCGMGMVYAARAFFEEGGLATCKCVISKPEDIHANVDADTCQREEIQSSLLKVSNPSRIKLCNAQGLQIASTLLNRDDNGIDGATDAALGIRAGKGGIWRYTVGLIGKPSAGKSTFFNVRHYYICSN